MPVYNRNGQFPRLSVPSIKLTDPAPFSNMKMQKVTSKIASRLDPMQFDFRVGFSLEED